MLSKFGTKCTISLDTSVDSFTGVGMTAVGVVYGGVSVAGGDTKCSSAISINCCAYGRRGFVEK